MKTQQMALLTQDALLLPDGRIEVRIVEPRYLTMVANVFKGYYPLAFATARRHGQPPCYPTATQCEIIDFNQLQDDSLSIVLEGRQRVKILSAAQQLDKLWLASTLPCQNWAQEPISGEFELISAALEQFYHVNPELLELYNHVNLDDASWVSQRWLEVLPMYNRDKLLLVNQPDCHKTMDFVLQLIKSHVE
ncbi:MULTISPECIES: LON peptidase substrate-binding domain-containing protein [Shewanella]|uniref:ATP-dependent protease n=1 Tax=Shewanella salipaludis TaxID=2723052 RepID=A0A972G045_9GAMM|nr:MULTISPECIES: LON peptidase substrate-binding domain-containing protein [Shewanella]MCE9685760.1 ATP-dependent protease [Shewanella sp. AS16]NMH65882.1 ATP-dependent protease [Shewanella salipaludis]